MDKAFAKCHTERTWVRELLAEFIGTFILVFLSPGHNDLLTSLLAKKSLMIFVLWIFRTEPPSEGGSDTIHQ
ncbi:hypothetical protein B566_EDAN005500 [Ephemera danica]|nr:hypothetical protein B566_EDAN005500 [Ephemera danica]